MLGATNRIRTVRPQTVLTASENGANFAFFLLLACLICLLTLSVFFREFVRSDYNLIAGNLGDNRLIIAILEHWRAVAHGHAAFTSPDFFWPEQDVLGYSDSLFLMSLPYMIGRSIGLDHYLAFEMAFIAFKAIGFFSMLWLLRAIAGTSRAVALLGAVLFTLSNLYFFSMGHSQLATVVFTPLIAGLACSAWREYGMGRIGVAYAYGVSCGTLTALVLFTSFYIGWFTVLAAAGCIVVATLVRMLERKSVSPVLEALRAAYYRRWMLGVSALAFVAAITPFLVTYIPTLKHTGGRTFEEILLYSPEPLDVLNVGPGNWMWRGLLKPILARLDQRPPMYAGEKVRGWPPLILLLALGGGVVGLIKLPRMEGIDSAQRKAQLLIVILSASFVCLWILPIHVGRWSLWWLVFKTVPGGSAIRVPARFNFVLNVLLVLCACLILEQLCSRRNRTRNVVFWGIAVLLAAEQINTAIQHTIDRTTEDAILAQVKRPPAGCSSFLLTEPAQAGRPYYANQIDAMLVARAENLPTINGYSGWVPPDWGLLLFDNNYMDHARKWVLSKGIMQGLCGLDLRNGSWTTSPNISPSVYSPGEVLDFRAGGNASHFEAEGWGDPEPGGSWTVGSHSVLMLQLPAQPASGLVLLIEAHAFTPPQRSHFDDTLLINGRIAAQWSITAQEPLLRRQVRLQAGLIRSRAVRIEFVNHDPRSPADLGLSADGRKVGLALHTLRLELSGPSERK
ncbi:MAG TPA: hypothetical protein VKV15_12210 [Bryobacteraceae bacterium]|nr:hypothetical protein [Bryobacteraceae bacterium]